METTENSLANAAHDNRTLTDILHGRRKPQPAAEAAIPLPEAQPVYACAVAGLPMETAEPSIPAAVQDTACKELFSQFIDEFYHRGEDKLLAAVLRRMARKESEGSLSNLEKLKCLLQEIGLLLRLQHARLRMVPVMLFKASEGKIKKIVFNYEQKEVELYTLAGQVEHAQKDFKEMIYILGTGRLGLQGEDFLNFWKEMTMLSVHFSPEEEDQMLRSPNNLAEIVQALVEYLSPSDHFKVAFQKALSQTLDTLWDMGLKALEVARIGELQAKGVDEEGKMLFHLENPETKKVKIFCQYFEFTA